MLSVMKISRYESGYETGKTRLGHSLTVGAVIEGGGSLHSTEQVWHGAIFGPVENLTPQRVMFVMAATADEARKQLAAALRKIADDLDQTQLP
jgi:hypothetical protein